MIKFEEFQKVDLRVAKVVEAERVKGTEKLVKLQIDLGKEQRQLVAGLADTYRAETLVGREIAVVVNLEPRTIFGLESQGMLLAASCDEEPVLLRPDKEVGPGAKIR